MIQSTIPVGRLMCNCQILVCPKTHEAVIVDPGDEADKILAEIAAIEKKINGRLKVRALFHTHAHFDHIGATRAVKETLVKKLELANSQTSGAHPLTAADLPTIYLHKGDEFIYSMLPKQASMFGFTMDAPLPIDQYFEDEQTLKFGKLKFTVLHTPGHSPGGVCFHMHSDSTHEIPEVVFTGDTLFKRDIGRADLWGGDEPTLIKSIKQRLLTLDEDTIAWPGHGPSTVIGHEKRENPYI